MRNLKFFLVLMLSSMQATAGCPNAIRLLPGAQNDTCERIGLSVDYDVTVRKQLVEGDYNKQLVQQQKQLLDLKDLQIADHEKEEGVLKDEVQRERSALDAERARAKLDFWIGAAAGVLTVVLSAWVVKRTIR